jgi:hypothetical protein
MAVFTVTTRIRIINALVPQVDGVVESLPDASFDMTSREIGYSETVEAKDEAEARQTIRSKLQQVVEAGGLVESDYTLEIAAVPRAGG